MQETRDVVFREGEAPAVPIDGTTIRKGEIQVQTGPQPTPLPPSIPSPAPQHGREDEQDASDVASSPDTKTRSEKLAI